MEFVGAPVVDMEEFRKNFDEEMDKIAKRMTRRLCEDIGRIVERALAPTKCEIELLKEELKVEHIDDEVHVTNMENNLNPVVGSESEYRVAAPINEGGKVVSMESDGGRGDHKMASTEEKKGCRPDDFWVGFTGGSFAEIFSASGTCGFMSDIERQRGRRESGGKTGDGKRGFTGGGNKDFVGGLNVCAGGVIFYWVERRGGRSDKGESMGCGSGGGPGFSGGTTTCNGQNGEKDSITKGRSGARGSSGGPRYFYGGDGVGEGQLGKEELLMSFLGLEV